MTYNFNKIDSLYNSLNYDNKYEVIEILRDINQEYSNFKNSAYVHDDDTNVWQKWHDLYQNLRANLYTWIDKDIRDKILDVFSECSKKYFRGLELHCNNFTEDNRPLSSKEKDQLFKYTQQLTIKGATSGDLSLTQELQILKNFLRVDKLVFFINASTSLACKYLLANIDDQEVKNSFASYANEMRTSALLYDETDNQELALYKLNLAAKIYCKHENWDTFFETLKNFTDIQRSAPTYGQDLNIRSNVQSAIVQTIAQNLNTFFEGQEYVKGAMFFHEFADFYNNNYNLNDIFGSLSEMLSREVYGLFADRAFYESVSNSHIEYFEDGDLAQISIRADNNLFIGTWDSMDSIVNIPPHLLGEINQVFCIYMQ
jgi:hypothetical protein